MSNSKRLLVHIAKPATVLITCLAITLFVFSANATQLADKQTIGTLKPAYKPAIVQNDLWTRVRSGFAINSYNNKTVRNNEISFTLNQIYINRITDRGKYYLYYIVEEVERRGMPMEMALLPIIESGFDPHAKSNSNAAGLWQFTPSTGKSFGLTQNQWHDDRKDVIAATKAALDYLQYLDTKFGDWELALAAYNWGPGSLKKALNKNRKQGLPTTFQHLKLPIETRNHIYKLTAIKNIVANPAAFGIKLDVIPNEPYFNKIETEYPIDITLVSRLAGISVQEFQKLNPAHKKGIINAADSPRTLLLPVSKTDSFLKNSATYNSASPSTKRLKVKRFSASVARNIAMDTSIVRTKPAFNQQLRITASIKKLTYTVKEGDTLAKIAKQYGLSVKQIKLWNKNNEKLAIGQPLTLIIK